MSKSQRGGCALFWRRFCSLPYFNVWTAVRPLCSGTNDALVRILIVCRSFLPLPCRPPAAARVRVIVAGECLHQIGGQRFLSGWLHAPFPSQSHFHRHLINPMGQTHRSFIETSISRHPRNLIN